MHTKLHWAAAVAFAIAGHSAAAANYSIDNLTARYGSGLLWARINNAGELAGINENYGMELRLRSGSVTYNASGDAFGNFPSALGQDGTVYFRQQNVDGSAASMRRAPDGSVTTMIGQMDFPGPYSSPHVSAVNGSGVAVGYAQNNLGYDRAVVYQGQKAVDLGIGATISSAHAINSQGAIVGDYQIGNYVDEAYVYANGQVTAFGGRYSSAIAINDANLIAGNKTFDNDGPNPRAYSRAFLYQDGTTTYIPLEGWKNTRAIDLSNTGTLLVEGYDGDDSRSFLYTQGETILVDDLLAAGGYAGWSGRAFDINDKGQILVRATNDAAGFMESRELLLTPMAPVPEPGTWAMLLAGLGCVGLVKRRARAA